MTARVIDPDILLCGGSIAVGDTWAEVTMSHEYNNNAVVVATPIAPEPGTLVTQVRNIGDRTFDVRVVATDGTRVERATVSWIAVNAGVHTPAAGVSIEAGIVEVPGVGAAGNFAPVLFNRGHVAAAPVVVGQALGDNVRWRAFHASGPELSDPPSSAGINVGVYADQPSDGEPTQVAVMVIEAGHHQVNGIEIDARVTRLGTGIESPGFELSIEPELAAVAPAGIVENVLPVVGLAGTGLDDAFIGTRLFTSSAWSEPAQETDEQMGAVVALNGDRDAARLAIQAGWGANPSQLRSLFQQGYASWLAQQVNEPQSLVTPYMDFIADEPFGHAGPSFWEDNNNGHDQLVNIGTPWMRNLLWESDQLRQRVTFALSQIFVVSGSDSLLTKAGASLGSYYDMLSDHALGNYRDLLSAVTYHPAMAYYLTHIGNRPASADGTRQPDENYARELMQLFTIGLWELNPDGSFKTELPLGERRDEFNQPIGIPTYDNGDIEVLSSIVTGLFYSGVTNVDYGTLGPLGHLVKSYHWSGINNNGAGYARKDLRIFHEFHDFADKTFLGNPIPAGIADSEIRIIPADRAQITNGALLRIEQALDVLFNHPNVGPFIGRRLIQFLVTSNPSPAYIERITNVFNDNGAGVRGDLHAVVTAILLDPEARRWDLDDPGRGKLVEPMVRMAAIARGFDFGADSPRELDAQDGLVFWDRFLRNRVGQQLMFSPSVFNFFGPDYRIPNGLKAPEAQILNPVTLPGMDRVIDAAFDPDKGFNLEARTPYLSADFSQWVNLLADPAQVEPNLEIVLDQLELTVGHGYLSDETRSIVRAAVNRTTPSNPTQRWRVASHLVAVSPDAAVAV